MSKQIKMTVAGTLATFYFLVIYFAPPLPNRMGQIDFAGYWSASYLLAHSQNFSNDQNLLAVQQTMTTLHESYPMKTWNPPWLLVLLLPLTWLSFAQASWAWPLFNITLLFVVAIWLHQMGQTNGKPLYFSLALALLFLFPSTLVALLFGQVNILVLFGLVAFLWANRQKHYFLAGCALALTLVKPQLVYLTLPILLLDCLYNRKWAVFRGLFSALLGLSLIAFLFRPTYLSDYLTTVSGGSLLAWQNPTLSSYLHAISGWEWVRWLGIELLVGLLAIWYRYRALVSSRMWLEISLLLSLISTPFAWSYDFVLLFIPMMAILDELALGNFFSPFRLAVFVIWMIFYGLMYYHRLRSPNELFFFWIPLAVAGIYGWVHLSVYSAKRVKVWN